MAASQEQITRSVDRLTADQEQMTREITKLQEIEQSIRSKNSEPSPRPAPASAPKPVSQSPPADDPVAYCMQRFRSYDPKTGTYLGHDGQRHSCP
jgi:hypothetical protein